MLREPKVQENKESQPIHTGKKNSPSYFSPQKLQAQLTLTITLQVEREPSADQNLIRLQPKFKTLLVY